MRRLLTLVAFTVTAVLAVSTAAALPALAATPLAAPTQLQAVHVDDHSADLWWTYDVNHREDVVQRQVNNAWQEVARSAGGVLELTNLTPGTTYTFRIFSVASPIAGYSDSPPSAPITFTTLAGPDAMPPTAPPAPMFSSITTTMVTVSWGESTDNVEVTGYSLQQLIGGVWTTIRTVTPAQRFQTVTGLTAGTTYQFAAIAFDARGNQSARGAAGSVSTLATTATATCRVQTIVFGTNFSTWITVINTRPPDDTYVSQIYTHPGCRDTYRTHFATYRRMPLKVPPRALTARSRALEGTSRTADPPAMGRRAMTA